MDFIQVFKINNIWNNQNWWSITKTKHMLEQIQEISEEMGIPNWIIDID